MKQRKVLISVLALVLVLTLGITVLAACNKDKDPADNGPYTISFDVNGASAPVASKSLDKDAAFELPLVQWPDHILLGWQLNGSGDVLEVGSNLKASANASYKAVWRDATVADYDGKWASADSNGDITKITKFVFNNLLDELFYLTINGNNDTAYELSEAGDYGYNFVIYAVDQQAHLANLNYHLWVGSEGLLYLSEVGEESSFATVYQHPVLIPDEYLGKWIVEPDYAHLDELEEYSEQFVNIGEELIELYIYNADNVANLSYTYSGDSLLQVVDNGFIASLRYLVDYDDETYGYADYHFYIDGNALKIAPVEEGVDGAALTMSNVTVSSEYYGEWTDDDTGAILTVDEWSWMLIDEGGGVEDEGVSIDSYSYYSFRSDNGYIVRAIPSYNGEDVDASVYHFYLDNGSIIWASVADDGNETILYTFVNGESGGGESIIDESYIGEWGDFNENMAIISEESIVIVLNISEEDTLEITCYPAAAEESDIEMKIEPAAKGYLVYGAVEEDDGSESLQIVHIWLENGRLYVALINDEVEDDAYVMAPFTDVNTQGEPLAINVYNKEHELLDTIYALKGDWGYVLNVSPASLATDVKPGQLVNVYYCDPSTNFNYDADSDVFNSYNIDDSHADADGALNVIVVVVGDPLDLAQSIDATYEGEYADENGMWNVIIESGSEGSITIDHYGSAQTFVIGEDIFLKDDKLAVIFDGSIYTLSLDSESNTLTLAVVDGNSYTLNKVEIDLSELIGIYVNSESEGQGITQVVISAEGIQITINGAKQTASGISYDSGMYSFYLGNDMYYLVVDQENSIIVYSADSSREEGTTLTMQVAE